MQKNKKGIIFGKTKNKSADTAEGKQYSMVDKMELLECEQELSHSMTWNSSLHL